MAKNVFSVPIFFIVFRETLEASLIIAVLLGLAKQVVYSDPSPSAVVAPTNGSRDSGSKHESDNISPTTDTAPELISDDEALRRTRLLRKIRIQVGPSVAAIPFAYACFRFYLDLHLASLLLWLSARRMSFHLERDTLSHQS